MPHGQSALCLSAAVREFNIFDTRVYGAVNSTPQSGINLLQTNIFFLNSQLWSLSPYFDFNRVAGRT